MRCVIDMVYSIVHVHARTGHAHTELLTHACNYSNYVIVAEH